MSKIQTKPTRKFLSNAFIYRFFMTLDFTISVFCSILAILYVVGNYQNFQDRSQTIIINSLSYASTFNILLSFILIVEAVFKIFTENHKIKHVIHVLILILTIIFCIICTEFSSIIYYLSAGLK